MQGIDPNPSRPKLCPNCGGMNMSTIPYLTKQSNETEAGWDCYCDKCEWSGNIEPDHKTVIQQKGLGEKE